MQKSRNSDAVLVVFGVAVCVSALAYLCVSAGCSQVKGFAYADDGVMNATQARQAAAVAQAEADALNSIANEQDRSARQILGAVDTAASTLGAPEIVSGLIGAAATLFVPPPGTRRKRLNEQKQQKQEIREMLTKVGK